MVFSRVKKDVGTYVEMLTMMAAGSKINCGYRLVIMV